ncbi:hypothetical protein FKW77_005439 [Venturia effusa]|uniref:PHD-type domain-containing protein n=1 Tax=Venturia effusa TaxID=50376 RepID=A0A517LFH9_9PEZI|nr:hypothetical protein FKW77_005439 [Venturia effusa]
MGSRKRGRDQMEAVEPVPEIAEEPSTLQKIREMWEFASLMQYLFFFGKAVKLEDLDVEDFEDECIKPTTSERLKQIGLALLKFVSSHKGLTLDLFDEYTRRQYVAKAPKRNPFGIEDEPAQFNDFDVFTKIRVLQQLSVWTLNNPNPIRERLDERESEQIGWRIEPFGWDRDDRVYFVLDDNRLYRRTDAPPPPEIATTKPKAKAKKGGRSTRSNKRRRVSRTIPETSPEDEDGVAQEVETGEPDAEEEKEQRPDDFFMQKWELIAITLDEYNTFIDTIRKSKDPNEKSLVKSIQEHVFPILAEQEEERQRKEARRLKELELMQKLATSKRSSRLAGKMDKIREQQEAEEAERRRREELEMAHKEQRKQQELENARESRRETREQRLKEREVKRILEEERLKQEEELLQKIKTDDLDAEAARARLSERKLKADMEKRKRELDNLQQDDEWYFDCSVCGVHGDNLDDGTHSIACEKCNVWQHSACHGISVQQAEREDFHFLCKDCKKKAANPVPPIKLKFGKGTPTKGDDAQAAKNGTQASPAPRPAAVVNGNGNGNASSKSEPLVYPGPPPTPPGLTPTVSGPTARPRLESSASPYQWQPPAHHYTPVTGPPAYNGYYQPPPPQGMYNPQSLHARPPSSAPQSYSGAPPSPYQHRSTQAPVANMQQSPHPPAQPSPTRPSPQMYVPPSSASPPPAMVAVSPRAQYTPRPNNSPRPQHFTPPAQYAAPYQPGFSPAKHASPRITSSPSLSSVMTPNIPPPHHPNSHSPIPVKHAPPTAQQSNGLGPEHLGVPPLLPAPSIGNGSFGPSQNGTNGSN